MIRTSAEDSQLPRSFRLLRVLASLFLFFGTAFSQVALVTGSNGLDLQQNALLIEVANSSTLPVANELVILTGAPSQATQALTTSTTGVVGICLVNCNVSGGTAVIATAGVAACIFDNATTAGDYVQASNSANGKCDDTTSTTYPTNGRQVIGRVLSSNSLSSTPRNIIIYSAETTPPALLASAAGGTVLGNTGSSAAAVSATNAPVLGVSSSGGSPTTGTLTFNNSANTGSVTLSPVSGSTTATLSMPDVTDTIAGLAATQTLTNKTLVTGTSGNNVTLVCGAGPQSAMTGNGSVQTFISCSIPANTITTNKVIRAHVVWQHTTGSAAVSYNWIFGTGTNTSYSCSAGCNNTAQSDTVYIYETGSNAQQMEAGPAYAGTGSSTGSHTITGLTQTVTGSLTIGYQFNVANTDKVTGTFLVVEIIQ